MRRFLEERTGWPGLLGRFLEERIPGGARWAYVFGSALLFLLAAQIASGLALALSYAPSVTTAWESVARLETTRMGHLLRALHAHGATFILAVAALHLLQTALYGAYRAPREVTWWLGLVLLALLLAFCLTGSLLPWDERGYWATRVTLGIAGTMPLAGRALARMLSAGPELGNLTLTRFYAVHAVLLPLLLIALAAAHVTGMRRHGVTPWRPAQSGEAFWPRQALRDAAFALLLLGALLGLALRAGAPLQGPADPSGAAFPRPDWYFRPLFQLLKLFSGPLEPVATVGVPLLAALFLGALPFLDRRGERLSQRAPALLVLAGGFLSAVALGVASYRADARNPGFQRAEALSRRRAAAALQLARQGVPPQGALAALQDLPESRGERLFRRACTGCHRLGDEGLDKAPRLDGYLSRSWVRGVIADPEAPGYFASSGVHGMDAYAHLGDEKLDGLSDFVLALRDRDAFAPELRSGRRLFEAEQCTECHALQEGKSEGGPTLHRYGSAPWLRGLLHDPASSLYYDGLNKMPIFGQKLSAAEIDDLVVFLSTLSKPQLTLTP